MPRQRDVVSCIFKEGGTSYDFDVGFFTLGMDRLWKNAILHETRDGARQYRKILDLACGTGNLTFDLARQHPDAQVVGVDMMPGYLAVAEAKKTEYGIENVTFVEARVEDLASKLPSGERFDLVATSYLLKYLPDIDGVIMVCAKLMQPGGTLVFHELTRPRDNVCRWLYDGYMNFIVPILPLSCWECTDELVNIMRGTTLDQDIVPALKRYGFTNIKFAWQPFQVAAIVTAVRT